MKKLQITLAAFILFFTLQASAQFSISLNLGSRPGYHNQNRYDDDVAYYYYPEIEAYYDSRGGDFIYNGPRGWVRASYLPEYCRNYDIKRGYRVAIDYRGRSPYDNFNNDRQRYFTNNCRNYREEYYNPRREYAQIYNGRGHRDYDEHNSYGRGERGERHENRGHSERHHDDD